MIQIRKFQKEDLEQIQQIDGVAGMFYDGTWYYIDQNREDIPLYRMQFELNVREGCKHESEVKN